MKDGVACIGSSACFANSERNVTEFVQADAGILASDLDVCSVELNALSRISRAGRQTRMVGHAFDVAILITVLEQPESVARIFNLAVPVQVTVVLALLALMLALQLTH